MGVAIVNAGFKTGFSETLGEPAGSESHVVGGDDKILAVHPDYTMLYGTERHHLQEWPSILVPGVCLYCV